MKFALPTPKMTAHPFKMPLLQRPPLGGSNCYRALDVCQALYLSPTRPGLDVSAVTLHSTKGAIPHAWRHISPEGALLVMADRSALVFAPTRELDIYRMLPTVFRLPDTVPFPNDHTLQGASNMCFDFRGNGSMRFGIRPSARSSGSGLSVNPTRPRMRSPTFCIAQGAHCNRK